MEVDARSLQLDFLSTGGGLSTLIETGEASLLSSFIIEKIEFDSYALRNLEPRVQRIVGVGAVSQSAARTAKSSRAFPLNNEGEAVSGGEIKPKTKSRVKPPDIYLVGAEHTSSLEEMQTRETDGTPVGSR